MNHIQLPIWVVRESPSGLLPDNFTDDTSRYVLAFDAPEEIRHHLPYHEAAGMRVHLIESAQAMLQLIAELRSEGKLGLQLQPELDGSGGKRFSLNDISAQIEKQKSGQSR